MMILRGSTTNIEKGHEPAARVGINPGAIQEVILGTIPKPEKAAKAPLINSRGVHSPSLDGQSNRRVSFCKPRDECLAVEGGNPSVEPSVSDLETWLEYHSTQIGTPMWWKELGAILGITDWQKFARKIQASFYIPEVWSRMFPEEGYSAPPTPQNLNRGAYLPDNLAYQDIR